MRRIALRPVQRDEFDAFTAADKAYYVEDMVTNGGMRQEDAIAKAQRDHASALPAGIDTPGHGLYFLIDPAQCEPIGRLWIAERAGVLFVYAIFLYKAARGRGLGREAMLLVEDEARRRAIGRIELNVFASNARARHLYRSLGYGEVAVYMAKAVG